MDKNEQTSHQETGGRLDNEPTRREWNRLFFCFIIVVVFGPIMSWGNDDGPVILFFFPPFSLELFENFGHFFLLLSVLSACLSVFALHNML